jgi:pimeloyl-ACP methyl ester carboxylesterase
MRAFWNSWLNEGSGHRKETCRQLNYKRKSSMSEKLRTFWSPEIEAQFNAAYEAVLKGWPVPYEELYIPTRFGDTHVVASGLQGAAPLVLLNPGGGSLAIWMRNVGPLSARYRTYAVDVIGEMNKSLPTRPIRSHPEFMNWMADLFDGLRLEATHLMGNSNGGCFALETALFLPERVRKVVLISPAATFVQMWAWWLRLLIPAHMIAPVIHSERMVHAAYDWLWQGFPVDEGYARLKSISTVAGYPRYRPTRNLISPRVFSDDELRRIQNPVLLLIGDHDVIYKPEEAIRRATRLVPGLKAEIVPNANHCAQYTAPEVVNKKILDFLSG